MCYRYFPAQGATTIPHFVREGIMGKILPVLCIVLFGLLFLQESYGQPKSNRGKEFYIALLPNYHQLPYTDDDSVYIYIVAEVATAGTIEYTPSGSTTPVTINFSIPNPSQIFTYRISWVNIELTGYNLFGSFTNPNDNEKPTKKSIRVTTNQDVAVYALNQANTTSDASLVLPTTAIGKEYYIMSYRADGLPDENKQMNTNYTPSEFAIVATEDNTTVVVEPTAPTAVSGAGTKQVVLNAGETYLVQSMYSNIQYNLDLTGSHVYADKPISVFAGHQRATLPISLRGVTGSPSRDCLYEQMFPTSVWGKSYIMTPFAQPSILFTTEGTDLFRVLAAEDGTEVRWNKTTILATLQKGQFYEAPLRVAGFLTSNKKVLVGTYKKTHTTSRSLGQLGIGDPFMMIIPPRSQYLDNYRFQNCQVSGTFTEQYITIVTTTDNAPNVSLDSVLITQPFIPIANTCYVYTHITMQDGAHTLSSPKPVGLYVYGYGYANSYGYVGGIAFRPDVDDIEVNAGGDKEICIGDSLVLSALGNATNIKWVAADGTKIPCDTCITTVVKPVKTTKYTLIATDAYACKINDEITVTVLPFPTVDATPDTTLCTDSPVTLVANGLFKQVEWSPPIGLSCTVCQQTRALPGKDQKYYAIARNSNSATCVVIDSVTIRYRPGVYAQVPPTTTICTGDSVVLDIQYGGKVKWTPSTGISCDTCTKVVFKPTVQTTYTVNGTSPDTCFTKASMLIKIVSKPKLEVQSKDVSVCKGEEKLVSISTDSESRIEWAPATFLDCPTCGVVRVKPDSNISYRIRVYNTTGSCYNEDSLSVRVIPKPELMISAKDSVTSVCAGDSVILMASAAVPAQYKWSPAEGLTCDTCAQTTAQPSTTTMYTVVATTDSGCIESKTINVTINPRPTLVLEKRDTTICQGTSFQIRTSTNGSIRWSPSLTLSCDTCPTPIATPATTTTYYATVQNNTGCSITDSVVATVHPLPTLQSTFKDTTICPLNSVQLSNQKPEPNVTYKWTPATGLDRDDIPNPTAHPTENTTYSVTATTQFGCVVTYSVKVTIAPCNRSLLYPLDITVPDVVACADTTVTFRLENNGDVPVIIKSLVQNGTTVATWEQENAPFPDTLQSSGSGNYTDVTLRVNPNKAGAFTIPLELTYDGGYNGNDTTIAIMLHGRGLKYPVTVKLIGAASKDDETKIGENVGVVLQIESSHWNELLITAMDVDVLYNKTWMMYKTPSNNTEQQGTALDSVWKITATAYENTTNVTDSIVYTRFSLRGTTPIAKNGDILSPQFSTLLSNVFQFTPMVRVSFPDEPPLYPRPIDCIDTTTSSYTIEVGGCAKYIRRIALGVATSGILSVTPNPVTNQSVSIRYGVGFDCNTRITLTDALGRDVAILVDGYQTGGEYEAVLSTQDIAAGAYYCRYTAAGVTQTTIITIAK
ncbi:MAG: hypothetical protein K1X91_00190 [Bacteriodetes bacterium]|nr:hypothetical protein [Bacteroidota bacterium]